jgi:hypothetical protein
MHSPQKSTPHQPLVNFRAELRIALARPPIDDAMPPRQDPTLCESITPQPSSRIRDTTLPRLNNIDVVEAHNSISYLHHLAAAPNNNALRDIH